MEGFKNFDRQLLKNCSNLIFNKHGRHIPVPNSDQIYSRRDYINYRLGASFQQLNILKQIAKNQSNAYLNVKGDTGEEITHIQNSIRQVSYCLDNLIFNLASMSDYLGNYIGLFLFGSDYQTIKWNGLVKKTSELFKNEGFGEVISAENRDWFDKLHSYRGDIIHRKAIMVEVDGYINTRLLPQPVPELHFVINESLKKYFHMVRGDTKTSVIDFSDLLCKRSLNGFSKILSASEKVDIRILDNHCEN